jgi:cytochrome o ubiquinol oxidase operon protein cyoD
MQTARHNRNVTTKTYLIGLGLALVLTAIPFGVVAAHALPNTSALAVIAGAAIVQVVVHLRFFLHLGLKRSSQENLLVLCFTVVLIVIMAGGSIWIMLDLNRRMM